MPLPNAMGNALSGGRVVPFARGGVVTGPTLFPMANGAGLMGEAGPEGILPLTRINGRLGVEATGIGSFGRRGRSCAIDVPGRASAARSTRGPDRGRHRGSRGR
jgi:lambda family phage tail tape measure protein